MTHILVPLDGSPLAETILPFVEQLSRPRACRVTLLYVTPVRQRTPPFMDHPGIDELVARDRRLAESYLSEQRRRLLVAGVDAAIIVATGDPAAEITRQADRIGADLVALSTHGRSGVQAWVHGSVADEVLHATHTPLLLVRPADHWDAAPHRVQRVIVPLDGSWEAETAIAVAELFAGPGGLPLVLMRCVEPVSLGFVADPSGIPYIGMQAILGTMVQEARDYLDSVAARLRARGMTVSTEVSVGATAQGIAAYARCAPGSIVALATHGHAGWRGALLGSVARRLARMVPTPVIVCPLPRAAAQRATSDAA